LARIENKRGHNPQDKSRISCLNWTQTPKGFLGGLSPEPDPAVRQLGEPLLPVPRAVDALARRLDPSGSKQRLESLHHPGCILHHGLIGPRQLPQRGTMRAPVIDRSRSAPRRSNSGSWWASTWSPLFPSRDFPRRSQTMTRSATGTRASCSHCAWVPSSNATWIAPGSPETKLFEQPIRGCTPSRGRAIRVAPPVVNLE